MSAMRLARGFTGREHHREVRRLLSRPLRFPAGQGRLRRVDASAFPPRPACRATLAAHTVTLDYNDADQVREAFRQIGAQIACVIVEPVAGNMNCVPPAPGFLQTLREECDRDGALLIFDEVMTGFRVALGRRAGALRRAPDLTTLGKIIGGGMPVGAFGGRRDIMEQLAPLGPVYQAGTLSGNPVAMAAGLATLELIAAPGFHERLNATTDVLVQRLAVAAASAACRSPPTTSAACSDFSSPRAPRRQLREGHGLRRRALQAILPPHARRGRVFRAVRVRGRLRVGGALAGRHRRDDRRGAAGVRESALQAASGDSHARFRMVLRSVCSRPDSPRPRIA